MVKHSAMTCLERAQALYLRIGVVGGLLHFRRRWLRSRFLLFSRRGNDAPPKPSRGLFNRVPVPGQPGVRDNFCPRLSNFGALLPSRGLSAVTKRRKTERSDSFRTRMEIREGLIMNHDACTPCQTKLNSARSSLLRGGSVDGRKTFSGKKCPVKRNAFGGKEPMN